MTNLVRRPSWGKVTVALTVLLLLPLGAFAQQLGAAASAVQALQDAIEAVQKSASPSVVNVTSTIMTQQGGVLGSQAVPAEGIGTGFVYDNQGHIVTNFHVVQDATSVSVTLVTGEVYDAKVVGKDPTTDLAVIQIKAGKLPAALKLGDDSKLKVGQFVVAMGNPFGLNQTITFGIISGLGRTIQSPNGQYIGEAIQTDAATNPGNSGGPLLDLNGMVIGVNSQIISPSEANAGVGFAIPASLVERVVPSLISKGSFAHPWIGIEALDLPPGAVEQLKKAGVPFSAESGVMVVSVVPGSPAEKAGLKGATKQVTIGQAQVPVGGDIIIGIDDRKIQQYPDLSAYLDSKASVGQTVQLDVMRGNKQIKVSVKLAERPSDQQLGIGQQQQQQGQSGQ